MQLASGQDKEKLWVDSVFQTLSTDDQVGQLFMLPVNASDRGKRTELLAQIRNMKPGAVVITGGGPSATAQLIQQIQSVTKVPVLIGMEAAYGPGQILDSLITFQKPMLQGSINDDTLLFKLGTTIGRQLRYLGIHLNFVPNTSINVIQKDYLSFFSDDKKRAATKAVTFMKGLRNGRVLSCARHTEYNQEPIEEDLQQKKMPDLKNNYLDTLSFYPFRQLIDNGVNGILTSPLHFSAPGKKKANPTAASQLFIGTILKKQLGFKGLVITDVSHLQHIAGKYKGKIERYAFEMGSDLLLNPYNLNQAIKKIKSSLKKNKKLKKQLEQSVKNLLSAKYEAGLNKVSTIEPGIVASKINSPAAFKLNEELASAAVTLAKNESKMIPIKTIDNKTFSSVSIGAPPQSAFVKYLSKYAPFQNFSANGIHEVNLLSEKLTESDIVVVALYPKYSKRREVHKWILELATKCEVIICSFGNPYGLSDLESLPSMVIGYTAEAPIPKVMAQVLFGATAARGTLPITVTPLLTEGIGHPNILLDRLGYGIPESVGMDSETLGKIRSIISKAIDSAATPGCNILIARKGKIIFEEAFGRLSYERQQPMTQTTIHDLASVTKVAATLQAVMFMYERGLIDVNKKASHYLPELKISNKKDFTIKDILTHQAGLWPYLPFWLQTIQDSTLLKDYYSSVQNEAYPLPVAENLFAIKSMKDSLWHWIVGAKIREKKPRTPYDYTYSDMGFYIMQRLAEKLLNQPMQDFLRQNFYDPLGAYTTGYSPLERFSSQQIAPTEVDMTFRKSKLVGYVHDQGAAMHGGIAGHAGLFSNANDLAKLGQMWLQRGSYGGIQYFKPETVDFFTTQQYETSRRGLGWDKPLRSEWNGPTSMYASPSTFGHTGFTGTAIWVDPEFDLVYVFLSNRIHPNMLNTKLLTENIRPRIQDVIYESIFEYCKRQNGE